ncbi:hypothetical protein HYX70_03460 [Candidatus Saccharibacteria bacterium]|nr:hypothetical protein [Candidatus Saccharibacteria bacterium]
MSKIATESRVQKAKPSRHGVPTRESMIGDIVDELGCSLDDANLTVTIIDRIGAKLRAGQSRVQIDTWAEFNAVHPLLNQIMPPGQRAPQAGTLHAKANAYASRDKQVALVHVGSKNCIIIADDVVV